MKSKDLTIQEVIRECVVALFQESILERTLVLKGGTALRLIEDIDSRLSTDLDFSVEGAITSPASYFKAVESALSRHFSHLGWTTFDAEHQRKPKERSEGHPQFWAGWYFEFKLVPGSKTTKNIEARRREALIPDGAVSSKIRLEISEHEYCGHTQRVKIKNSEIISYSNVLLVLEKIRAICQQHPEYPYGQSRNRARDYYDIFQLVKKYRSEAFFVELKRELPSVFNAKSVPQELLRRIFDLEFVAFQSSHFPSVEATVSGRIEPFEFYLEQLKLLLSDIGVFFPT